MQTNPLDRRTVIRGAAVVAAGATLAACGSSSTPAASATSSAAPSASSLDPSSTFAAIGGATGVVPSEPAASNAGAAENGIGSTAGVAVGGGAVFEAAKIVVTQPTAGSYKAFTAVCTHQGCLVASIANGAISCPCHGSTFSIKDGAVISGPATEPLKAEKITVTGTTIKLG